MNLDEEIIILFILIIPLNPVQKQKDTKIPSKKIE